MIPLWVSRVLKYPKKCLEDLTTFFMSTWGGDSKNMEEIEFPQWLFEGRPRQGKNVLPDGLNWLCYFAGSSKSHRENSISCIFLESPHQVLRYEKCCQMLQTLFWLFQCSKNPRCKGTLHGMSLLIVRINNTLLKSNCNHWEKLFTYFFNSQK